MRALTKKLLRTILESRGQSIAVAAVVLCGTACYISLASIHRNLLLTRDAYYAEYRFADFEIMLERAPTTSLFKVESIPGVRHARARIVEDVIVDIEGIDEARAGRLVSMPNHDEPVLNDIVVQEGRYFDPSALNEVILSERFAEANGLGLGDEIDITVDGKRHELRIVGLGLSPEYVYIIRNVQEFLPSPERFGILWVPQDFAESALSMQAACNNIVGTVDDPEQLDQILDRAENVLDAYGVFAKVKRENQISNRFISDEIAGLAVSSKVTPAVFLGIAALVIMILLNRMVRNERTQIGLMKAYGYSDWAVAFHYIQYALILSIAGCAAGFVVGQLFSLRLIHLYGEYYQFPLLRSRIYPDVLLRSMGIAMGFALLGAIVAATRGARIKPAESMRPEAPRIGHRTLIERIPALWSRISFTWKMIVRNVSRNPFRAGLNAFGVMIACGLLVVGFFAMDGMDYLLKFQYELTQREDLKLNLYTERGKDALYEASRLDHVRLAEPVLEYPFEMRNGWRSKDILVIGIEQDSKLRHLIDYKENPVDVGTSGLVLSDRLARDMNAGVGDLITLEPLMGRIDTVKQVPVSKVVKQYFGASAYMNIDALSHVLNESHAMNSILLSTDPGTASKVNEDLKDVPAISAVEIKADSLKSVQDTLAQSMWIMSVVVILFAGVISFSVIYNVTLVSLGERQRELASLRVLGFTPQEVGRVLYYENFLTGAIGLLLGGPFGYVICAAMVKAYDTELYRLPLKIDPQSYMLAGLGAAVFIVIANLAVRNKIRKLDMVEVLKERE